MLSQQELADRAGVSLFTVQRIERGEGSVRPKTGRAVAGALGVGVEALLGKAQAPLWPEFEDPVGPIDDYAAATAAAKISGASEWAEGLAAEWRREEAEVAVLSKYRTFEMSCTVVMLYQQFWEALETLQSHAGGKGLNPNPATWEPESKRRLFESGSSIRTLAGLYERIRESGEAKEEEEVRKFAAQLDTFIAELDYEKAG